MERLVVGHLVLAVAVLARVDQLLDLDALDVVDHRLHRARARLRGLGLLDVPVLLALLHEDDVLPRTRVAVAATGQIDLVDLLDVVVGDLDLREGRACPLHAVGRCIGGLLLPLQGDRAAEHREDDDRKDELLVRRHGSYLLKGGTCPSSSGARASGRARRTRRRAARRARATTGRSTGACRAVPCTPRPSSGCPPRRLRR